MPKSYSAKIVHLQISYAQKGTIVEGVLSIPTKLQYTNELINFRRDYDGHSLIKALWKFRKDAKNYGVECQKADGEYDLNPTDFSPGLLWT